MRGHIVQRSKNKGTYSIVLELDKDAATGKRHQQWITFQGSLTEAKKRLTELLHQKDNGALMKPGKTTVAEYLQRWLADYAKPNISPRGYERYKGIIEKHFTPAFGGLALTQLKPEHLQKHYTEALNGGLAARTVRYHHAVVHKALQTAVQWGLITRNVADAVTAPRSHRHDTPGMRMRSTRFLKPQKIANTTPCFIQPCLLVCGALKCWRSGGRT